METIRRHTFRQRDALAAVALALLAVLAYSVWGSYLLHQQDLAQAANSPAVADNR